MIRRDAPPEGFLLITQHDHALLSGELARHVGNAAFASLVDFPPALLGIALHDCGWPLHDDAPILNRADQPVDVFESPPEVGLRVWQESVDRAAAQDAYAGLLVSLHVLHLSLLFGPASVRDAHQRFALNKFHHAQFERQEHLRRAVGLRIDRPLTHGLLEAGVDRDEDLLRFRFRWLQALDQISLGLCCTAPPATTTTELHPRPGARTTTLSIGRARDGTLAVSPWPFASDSLDLSIAGRVVPRGPYASVEPFRAAYDAAPRRDLPLRLAR